ncbi:transcription initiation factor TFIID subunit 8 [Corylus avellana]|uniref:transcription initiation factor TFIID subunit 8 n=1 Tax=Corylus avellana TaxID=13451 RepID=UPI001E20CDE2|nr:transcription initiation factor TFIID subunit 8 [Corylus avellana]
MKSKKAIALTTSMTTNKTTTIPSEFWFAIARTAVSQICQSVGFKATQLSALETLTLVATKYLQAIAHSAAAFTNHSSRIQSNLLDLTHALHGVVSLHSGGFSGGSILHKDSSTLLLASGVLKDLSRFVEFHDEIPFAKPVPRRNNCSSPENSIPASRKPDHHSHVPKWLPEFPEGKERRAREERLWEEDSVIAGDCNDEKKDNNKGKRVVVVKERKQAELGVVGRGRVRFRIGRGVGLRNGDKGKGIEEDDKCSGFKRRRR